MSNFTIAYLWRGERHHSLATFATRLEALAALQEFRNDGWQAWYVEGPSARDMAERNTAAGV
jgi:hypothetical protein